MDSELTLRAAHRPVLYYPCVPYLIRKQIQYPLNKLILVTVENSNEGKQKTNKIYKLNLLVHHVQMYHKEVTEVSLRLVDHIRENVNQKLLGQ